MVACLCFLYAAAVAVYLFWPLVLLAVGYAAWRRSRQWQGSGWAFGTARLSNYQDLHRAQLIGHGGGLILARAGFTAPPPRWQAVRTLFTTPLRRSDEACRLFLAAFSGRRGGVRS
jgi:hypothetical protein